MSYYIGLSILSNIPACKGERRQLKAETMRILSQLEGRPITENDIAREGQGRPYFRSEGFPSRDFSISHSGKLAAVSLVTGANIRTGCDVELVRKRARANEIADEYFCATERDYIFSLGHFDEARFFQIWTLKECFLKLHGQTVFDMPLVPSFFSGKDSCMGQLAFDADVSTPLTFYLYELGDRDERYILATAIEGRGELPEIRWYSRVSLPCRCIAKIN